MASQMNVVGTYPDPIYGGNISVCVTYVSSTNQYVGQALFSQVGYMRGTIESAAGSVEQFNGNWYSAGQEVKQGTFALEWTPGTPNTLSGTFYEKPGITYDFSTTQISTATPSDLECFKTDADYLVASPPTKDFTGLYTVGYDTCINQDFDLDFVTASYLYYYEDGTAAPGILYHNPTYENGQVTSGNWYEGSEDGPVMGIEIWVAKNATAYYESWWYFERMADFNYTFVDSVDDHGIDIGYMLSSDCSISAATENSCYMLPTSAEESSCLDTGSSSCNSYTGLAVTGILFGVISVVAAGYIFAKTLFAPSVPLSRADSSANNL